MEYDFIGIGDITTDAFIKIKDATVNCDINRDACLLSLRFGDKIPYEEVHEICAVGNAPNATVSAHRLGLNAAIVTDIGGDQHGKDTLTALKNAGVDTAFVTTHPKEESNYHYVLWYEEERTILVKHQEYAYSLPEFTAPKWIYLSSLAKNSLAYHDQIVRYLENHPQTRLAFQPGTFQMKLGYEKLKNIYELTELFFCNKSEAQNILKTDENDMKSLLTMLHERGVSIPVITDGPKGAYASDGATSWYIPMYPDPKPPVERTGAGDSFASAFTTALALGKDIPTALSWGPINSMSVVQYVGAQEGLLTKSDIENFLKKAPGDYKPQKI